MARNRRDRSPRKLVSPVSILSPVRRRLVLTPVRRFPIGDRRFFHPMGELRPVVSVERAARRLVPARKALPSRSRVSIPERIGFAVPEKVMVCVRRKVRREVIHAKRLTGRGARAPRRRNIWSNVSC